MANIYLDKFDKYMKEYAEQFDKGKEKRFNPLYAHFNKKEIKLRKKFRTEKDRVKKAELLEQLQEVQAEMHSINVFMETDADFKRLKYVRYADNFLICVIGSKAHYVKMKEDFTKFMNEKLKLELSTEKTPITNAHDSVKFLGYVPFKEIRKDISNVSSTDL